jgi:biotin operon repressor
MVTLAAIELLAEPTVTTIAAYTGLSKGNVDNYVETLKEQLGVVILKKDSVYSLVSWGQVLKESGVRRYLTGSV